MAALLVVAVVVIAIAGAATAVVVTAAVLVVAEVIEQWQSEVVMIQIRDLSLTLKSLGALVMYFWDKMDFWWKEQ